MIARAVVLSSMVLGATVSHAANYYLTLSGPPSGLRWGYDSLVFHQYQPQGASCTTPIPLGDPFNLRTTPGEIKVGSGNLPDIACNAETQSPVYGDWDVFLPGAYTVYADVAGFGARSTPLGTSVHFDHDLHFPQLGVDATFASSPPLSQCAARSVQAVGSPAIGLPQRFALSGVISFEATNCTIYVGSPHFGWPSHGPNHEQVIGLSLAPDITSVWVNDKQQTNGGAATWREVPLAGPGMAAFKVMGDTSGISALVALGRPAPPSVSPTPDLWWGGSAEAGWGLNIATAGDNLFVSGFIYDQAGKPTWIVMPNGQWDAFHTTWKGDVYIPHGSSYASYSGTALDMRPPVGSASLDFSNPEQGSFDFVIDGYRSSKPVTRFVFVPGAGAGPYAGIWWGGTGQDGWGLSIAQQGETLFATWYTYGADGMPTWFYMPSPAKTGEGKYSGTLYRTTGGPWLSVAQYNGAQTQSMPVGTMELSFKDGQSGTMSAVVDGIKATNAIQRFGF